MNDQTPCPGTRYANSLRDFVTSCTLREDCERFKLYKNSGETPIIARWRYGTGGDRDWCWDFLEKRPRNGKDCGLPGGL
jgi:hypothetical protein